MSKLGDSSGYGKIAQSTSILSRNISEIKLSAWTKIPLNLWFLHNIATFGVKWCLFKFSPILDIPYVIYMHQFSSEDIDIYTEREIQSEKETKKEKKPTRRLHQEEKRRYSYKC